MLQAIVSWSLHNRVAVVVFAVLLLCGGFLATRYARLDVFPEFAPPEVVIQTEAPGLSSLDVELLVTRKIETAVNGISRLDVLRSRSIQGLSVVTIIFQDGTDVYRARQQVSERLAELSGELPEGVKPPRMEPLTTTTGRLVTVGFTADPQHKSPPNAMDLRDLAQWTVRPRLLAVPGVASVTLYGGEVRQFQVQVDPAALAARHLTLTDVLDATRQASGIRGAGFIENSRQRLTLRVEAQVRTVAELGQTVINSVNGTPVYLKDVARVIEGAEPKFGDAAIGNEPGVVLIVYKQYDADTIDVTRRVEAELARLEPQLKARGVHYHLALFRQASFIEHAVGNVTSSLLLGAVLVCVVLFLFLFNLRVAFISLTAIPLSLLSAVLVLWGLGISLNTLTLGGLAIAVGEVVDDAIIDVENIHRRLRENSLLARPRSALSVVLSASLEVRTAVVYATFIVVLVFVPVFFMSGLQGRLFAPLGYAYVLAVLASLATAVTVTPALSLLLLAKRDGEHREPEGEQRNILSVPDTSHPFLLRWLQAGYDRLLRVFDREYALVLTLTVLLVVGAGWALRRFGGEFLPELRENHYVVHMRGMPGTSLPQSLATGQRVRKALAGIKGVRSVNQQIGRAELGEDTWGVDYSELEVDLERLPADEAERVEREIRETLKDVPGFFFEVLPFLKERINETLSGSNAAIAVKIYNDDLDALDQAAETVTKALKQVKGNKDVRAEAQTGAPELVIRPRLEALGRFGLRRAHVLDAAHAAYQGADVGQTYNGTRTIDLVVVLPPALRETPDQVADLWLSVPPGIDAEPVSPAREPGGRGRIQLKQAADVYHSDGRFLLAHEGSLRRQVVSCNVAGRDIASFAAEAEREVNDLPLPRGTTVVLAGEHEARATAQREIILLSLAAGAVILLLLWMVFRSLRRLLLIAVGVPFALVGGVAAAFLRGGILDVGSLIGFVTLFGITMRNGIMMVSHWQHLHEVEGMPWGSELVFRGARERLAPVLMTALVTALGLLPIALGAGEAGREIEGPMAQVILGGLATSTALNLLVLPVLYRRAGP
jgi:CzcA family heavy metal efflux pump